MTSRPLLLATLLAARAVLAGAAETVCPASAGGAPESDWAMFQLRQSTSEAGFVSAASAARVLHDEGEGKTSQNQTKGTREDGTPGLLEKEGWCLDSQNRKYSSLDVQLENKPCKTWRKGEIPAGMGCKETECMEALRDASDAIAGVRGAQLREGGSCEILADPGVRLRGTETLHDFSWNWGTKRTQGQGQGIVVKASGDFFWKCWKVN